MTKPSPKAPESLEGIEIMPEMIEAGVEAYREWADKNLFGDAAIAADEPDHIVQKLVVSVIKCMGG